MSNEITQARDNFLDNLHSMATGSYLREEDKEFWEAPYPESVVSEARLILDDLISDANNASAVAPHDFQQAAETGGEAGDEDAGTITSVETLAMISVVNRHVNPLLALSEKHDGAMLEDEEVSDLNELIRALSRKVGADEEAVVAHVDQLVDSYGN